MGFAPERYFYHSFPRRKDKTGEEEKGLKILGLMKKMGLLLTPEIVPWSEGYFTVQTRCCFTELAPAELLEHAKVFGHFAIEFDIKVLRGFGAIPVFYLPTGDASGELAAALVACIGDIDVLLCRLSRLEASVRSNPNKNNSVGTLNNGMVERDIACSVREAEDLLSFLSEGNEPLISLRAGLQGLSGFFKPTEPLNSTELLTYYREREWRILSGASRKNVKIARPLVKDEVEWLLRLDRQFFGEQLLFRTGLDRRVEQCRVLDQLNEKPILRYARRVIVPAGAVASATEILNDAEDPRVEALESIGAKRCG